MRSLRLAAAVVISLLASCSTTSWQVAPQPKPDDPIPAGRARVIVVRESGAIGSMREVRIYEDERQIGVLGENGWLAWDRVAQRGVGRVEFQGYKIEYGTVENVFDLPREAGSTTWAVLRLRRSDRKPMAEVVTPEEGRKLIAECTAAEVR